MDQTLLDYLLSQTIGVVFAAVCLYLYVKEKHGTERRLVDIIRDRKADRDALLQTLARVETHLQRADAFEEFSRAALAEAQRPDVPKRRKSDRLLASALAEADDDQPQRRTQ